MQKIAQLQKDYLQARLDCDKMGLVALVTPLTPAGDRVRFDCVSPENPEYKAQIGDVDKSLPPTDLGPRLQALVGQNVSAAVGRIGGPQGEPLVNGDVVYEWSSSTQTTLGATVIYNVELTTSCVIRLTTDFKTRIIKSFEVRERRGGCAGYAKRLDTPPV